MPPEPTLTFPTLSLASLLLNMAIGGVLAVVLQWHFRTFGSTLSNRDDLAHVFPFVLLTTVLIITVVKSSLALSLGLVGALSIVRFRTPVKEPEELAYLFMAIAMGLGLGANQTLPTVIAGGLILTAVAVLRHVRTGKETKNLYLSLEWPNADTTGHPIQALAAVVGRHVTTGDLRRVNKRNGALEVTYFVDVPHADNVSALVEELEETFPGLGVTFIDQNQMPSI
jgi:Domain of unknown function (DUF4956)